MALGFFLLAFGVVLSIYVYLKRLRFNRFADKLGCSEGYPLIGTLHQFIFMKDPLTEYTVNGNMLLKPTTFAWLGHIPFLATKEPMVIEKILSSPNSQNKPYPYNAFTASIGPGLLTSSPPTSTVHRKLLNPVFKHNILLSFFSNFNRGADDFLRDFEKLVGQGGNPLATMVFNGTLNISIETTLGVTPKDLAGRGLKLLHSAELILGTTVKRLFNPWLLPDFIFRMSKQYKPYMEAKSFVDNFVEEILLRRISSREAEGPKKQEDEDSGIIKKSPTMFIDQVIDLYLNKQFTWTDLTGETATMIYATLETTATTLNSAIVFLATNPQYQERLYEEVLNVFPEKIFDVNFEDLSKLPYMDMIINETLRVAATGPLVLREASGDIPIKEGLTIPKDTLIIIDIFSLHRNPTIWGPNATLFNPENFLPENLADKHPYSFLPFLKGFRKCIGWQYATMLLKVILSKVIRNYKFTTKCQYKDLDYVVRTTVSFKQNPEIEVHWR